MELSKKERNTMDRFIKETKPRVNKVKSLLIVGSIGVSLVIALLTRSYWVGGNISYTTSLIIGGQLFTLYGAALAAAGATYRTTAMTLMSMTRYDGNPELFYQLTKTTLFTKTGFYFLTFGLLVQAASMILNEAIGL